MTEFETTTIAFQNASLWATYVQAEVALLVGLGQCLLIFYGLKRMQWGNTNRAAQNQMLFDKMDKQHEENVLVLRTLIERTAPR